MGKINEENKWGKLMRRNYGENYAVLAARPSCPGLAAPA